MNIPLQVIHNNMRATLNRMRVRLLKIKRTDSPYGYRTLILTHDYEWIEGVSYPGPDHLVDHVNTGSGPISRLKKAKELGFTHFGFGHDETVWRPIK